MGDATETERLQAQAFTVLKEKLEDSKKHTGENKEAIGNFRSDLYGFIISMYGVSSYEKYTPNLAEAIIFSSLKTIQ